MRHLHSLAMVFSKIILSGIFLLFFADGRAQSEPGPTLLPGFHHAIAGEVIPYFSVYRQYAREALLTRCTDGKKIIEWETDSIPANIQGDFAWFTWISAHSSGTSSGTRYFDLYINDEPVLRFSTEAKQYPAWWSFNGKDSTRLLFEFKTRDGANDSHGMAYLRVPLSKYKRGSALRLKVVGAPQQSNDWYMTFKYQFREKVEIAALPFIRMDKQQVLQVTALHFGAPTTLLLNLGSALVQEYTVVNGFNRFEIPVPAVDEKSQVHIRAVIGDQQLFDADVVVNPVRFRELNLIHHSHTDIGYSHLQGEVIRIHNHNIREALRLIQKTRDYPDGSRFIWHIESAWVAENFLREANAKERMDFFQALRNQQILLSANYANIMTGLCLPEEMDWITDYAYSLKKKEKIPLTTAMLTDVPGMSWSVVNTLAKRGIRYFSNGINYIEGMPGGGDRIGQALSAHGDQPFWWVSATGKDSILMWCAGKGYSSWHGIAQGAVKELGPEKIAAYLQQLDDKNYPYDLVQWRYNIVADNGPTDSTISDFVREWNENYYSPKLVIANADQLFTRFENMYGNKIPVLKGDFTPYWEDGAYSTAREEAANRLTAQKIVTLEKIAGQKKIKIDPEIIRLAKKYVVLFHEHTWGAHNSISEPELDFVKKQWDYKKSYLDSAILYTRMLESILQQKLPAAPGQIRVFNSSPVIVSQYVEMDCPKWFRENYLIGPDGHPIPVQHLPNGKLGFIAREIPANGEKRYRAVAGASKRFPSPDYRIKSVVDTTNGLIHNIRSNNREWVAAQGSFRGMGQPIYVDGTDPNYYDTARLTAIVNQADGLVVRKKKMSYSLKGTRSIEIEISEYNGLDYAKISVNINKIPVRTKEAVHLALPFNLSEAKIRFDAGVGIVGPEFLQLAGANRDFFSAQRWINVSGKEGNVTIVSPQAALFESGEMINENKVLNGYKQWKKSATASPLLFLYVLNNYWHTNFKADQEGAIRFDIYLQFDSGPFLKEKAEQFSSSSLTALWTIGY